MLLDANLLIYAVDENSPMHQAAVSWLTRQLNGSRRVGLPWQSTGAFLRIVTHPRVFPRPLSPATAYNRVTDWLSTPVAWIPQPGPEYHRILGRLLDNTSVGGNLIPDAMLAALAIEHGVTLYSADTDFGRFTDLRWENPLRR
ncbi:type II toxin-antitoxin system VapC family toxin [Mycobacterium sp. CSUR Q5927]|nr:type II toxin-antitoxin system VapC family toxin [Mycobacterium sp. CSUR Q5927]